MAHALGRSMPARLFLPGREGVVTTVSAEWESVELELDDGERVSSVEMAGTRAQLGASRRLARRAGGSPRAEWAQGRLLGWVGSSGRWRVQFDRINDSPESRNRASTRPTLRMLVERFFAIAVAAKPSSRDCRTSLGSALGAAGGHRLELAPERTGTGTGNGGGTRTDSDDDGNPDEWAEGAYHLRRETWFGIGA
ncbi:hypothetical protein T492DRAFT_859813 [Pavlovales sp. CCMP2436]|nr:hypothetical protein T492DRAFT_859813 [Pavlovales sp. CCMP2436]